MAGKRQRLLSEVASVQPGRSKLDDRTDKVRESVSSKKTKRNDEDLQINDQQISAIDYLIETYMIEAIVTATEMKNNFDEYLDMVIRGNEVIVTGNGKELGRFIPKSRSISYLTDSLTGIIKGEYDLKREKARILDLNMPATHCGK